MLNDQLQQTIRTIDAQIGELQRKRAVVESLLSGDSTSPQKLKTKGEVMISHVVNFINSEGRPIRSSDILRHFREIGIQLGTKRSTEQQMLDSYLRIETKKPNGAIVRISRGLYDVRKETQDDQL